MTTAGKVALATAGCAALIFAYLKRMGKTKAELIVTPEVSVHSISLNGLVLRAEVNIKNPNAGAFSIQFPFVTLWYKSSLLGSSHPVNQEIAIKPYSEAHIQAIMIDVPLASVFSVVSSLINAIQNRQSVKITVKVKTAVNLGWNKVDYEDTQEITLKN